MNGVEIKIYFIPMEKMHVHFLPVSLDVRNEYLPFVVAARGTCKS